MPTYFEFEVALQYIKPKIWRRFLLDACGSFADLHKAIQNAGPWFEEHLWEFHACGRDQKTLAGLPLPKEDRFIFDQKIPDARKVKLADFFKKKGDKCIYHYDFGDDWEHEVKLSQVVELPEKFQCRLLDGERNFPPEDCGGPWGYYDCLLAIGAIQWKGPAKEAPPKKYLKERREWLDDWSPELDLDKARAMFDK